MAAKQDDNAFTTIYRSTIEATTFSLNKFSQKLSRNQI